MPTLRRRFALVGHVSAVALTVTLLVNLHGAAQAMEDGATSQENGSPEVWLCAGDRIANLLELDAEWPFVKQHLTGIKFYIGQLYGPRGESPDGTMERLREYVRMVKAYDLQVAVELGGCLDFSPLDDTAGEWSARRELSAIDKFYGAGGKVDFLDFQSDREFPARRKHLG